MEPGAALPCRRSGGVSTGQPDSVRQPSRDRRVFKSWPRAVDPCDVCPGGRDIVEITDYISDDPRHAGPVIRWSGLALGWLAVYMHARDATHTVSHPTIDIR